MSFTDAPAPVLCGRSVNPDQLETGDHEHQAEGNYAFCKPGDVKVRSQSMWATAL
jgi:hypothetical protein